MKEASFFKRVRRIEIVAAKLVDELLSGNYRSTFRGQGIEFDEVREYVPGDDVRIIDWNVTSRLGAPYTKIFREERELTLFLLVDVSASLFGSSGELRKSDFATLIAAILALSAQVNNDQVGAVFFSDRVERWRPPAKGRRHILGLINDLLRIEPEGQGSDLEMALKIVYKNLKRRGICFIISDFKTADYYEPLSLLARKHDCVAIKLVDPVDREFPPSGLICLEDPESGRTLVSEGSSERFRRSYAAFWEEEHSQWREACRKRGVETISLATADDPGQELYRFFQRRRKKR
jgi:uncharacterized protein (DUF58 family)